MSTIEFEAKTQAKTVNEFVDSLFTKDSKFVFHRINDSKYEVTISNKHYSLLIHPAGFANTLAKGIINENVVNNENPEILVKPTLLYYGFQCLVIAFYMFAFVSCVRTSDYEFILFLSLIVFVMIGFSYLAMRFGKALFIGEFIEEQKNK